MAKRHAAAASPHRALARIEEIVLASSGADAFELVFAIAAARLAAPKARGRAGLVKAIARAANEWPGLDVTNALDVSDDVLAEVERLVDTMGMGEGAEMLDATFEQLVTRVSKGQKGQFFTPRHVVEFAVKALAPKKGERVVDPACGSGAFLAHARTMAKVDAHGFDVDARAVRVARLLAVATKGDPASIVRADSLRIDTRMPASIDAIATNPPFAGDAKYEGYALSRDDKRVERDTLFVERCVTMLRPGGRLAIVLPHNKVAARSSSPLRRWLVDHARVFAVVSLPRETFQPHTSQKAVIVFAKRRDRERPSPKEKIFFAVSERAGKDAAGERDVSAWRATDHDLGTIAGPLARFFDAEGWTS